MPAIDRERYQKRIDILGNPHRQIVSRGGVLLHVEDPRVLRGNTDRITPGGISYDLVGRLLDADERGKVEVTDKSRPAELRLRRWHRGLTEDVMGAEIFPKDKGDAKSVEFSHRTVNRTNRPIDGTPTYRVSPGTNQVEVLFFSQGSDGARLLVPQGVVLLSGRVNGAKQYIADEEVEVHEVGENNMVVLHAVPHSIVPNNERVEYSYITTGSRLDTPGHAEDSVHPVNVVGTAKTPRGSASYIRGVKHSELKGSRIDGKTGPELVVYPDPASSYTIFDIQDRRPSVLVDQLRIEAGVPARV